MTEKQFKYLLDGLMNFTWDVNGREINLARKGWKLVLSKRMTVALGRCRHSRRTGTLEIILNHKLILANLNSGGLWQLEDTMRHEIAHAIDFELHGDSSHGPRWQQICLQVCAMPNTRSSKKLSAIKAKYLVRCLKCGREYGKSRRPQFGVACGHCCKKHNGGRWAAEYVYEVKQNY